MPDQSPFSDLPAGAQVVSVPQSTAPAQTPAQSQASQSFSDLPAGAQVVSVPNTTATTPSEPSLAQRAATLGSNVLQGVGEGALSTVHGTGELIRKGLNLVPGVDNLGNRVIPQQGQAALAQIATPENLAQGAGYTVENIAEFMLGDEALKGLSLAAKLKQVGPAMKLLNETPVLRNQIVQKMIASGVKAGAVAGTQEFVHSGGDPVKSVEVGAAIGGAGALAAGVTHVFSPKTGLLPVRQAIQGSKIVQPELQAGIRGAAETATAEVKVPTVAGPSIRTAVEDVGDNVFSKSKGQYSQLDQASGGRWQRFDDQVANLNDKMGEVNGIDDDAYEKFETKRDNIIKSQTTLVNDLVKAGKISPDLATEATNNYRRAHDLAHAELKMDSPGRIPRPALISRLRWQSVVLGNLTPWS